MKLKYLALVLISVALIAGCVQQTEKPNCEEITCENCKSGTMITVTTEEGEVCEECLFDKSCKEGFSCIKKKCVDMSKQAEGSDCSTDADCPEGTHCAPQDTCVKNEIVDEFDSCEDKAAADECKSKVCENCEKGTYTCPFSSGPINQKCIECFIDQSCKEGFVCESYRCVAITTSP